MKFWILIKSIIPKMMIIGLLFIIIYFLFIRSWSLQIGVKESEINISLPGDNLVKAPNMEYMQAKTINAPKGIVWKYLIQVGYKRAGWYNLDFINRISAKNYFYENDRSADRIIPELQDLKEGDQIFLNPQIGLDVLTLLNNETMLLSASENNNYMVTWVFKLKEIDVNRTRLFVRWRSNLGNNILLRAANLLFVEPGSAIQQSQMLKGIKKRAENEYSLQTS